MLDKQTCRKCGSTGVDPVTPTQHCPQCGGFGWLSQGVPNPVGPGVQRLVQAAQVGEKPGAAPMMIAWDKVKVLKAENLVDKLTAVYGRRDRRQRRAYAKLTQRAIELEVLVAVPKPCPHGQPGGKECPWCVGTAA